jgi:uncharacterized protein involved in response to NO
MFCCALLIVGSFAVEAWVSARLGLILRVLVSGGFLWVTIPWRGLRMARSGTLATVLKLALATGLAGLAASAIMPVRQVALDHLFYLGCLGLVTLVVGSRVVLGHSGEGNLAMAKSWPFRAVASLALLATATRVSADFLPSGPETHHLYAALAWTFSVLIWLAWHRLRFFRSDIG